MRNNPYAQFRETNRKQLKVNFHTHAGVCMPNKCGELPMDEVIRAYHKAKYDALAISNHNEYIPPPLNNELLVYRCGRIHRPPTYEPGGNISFP